MNTVKIHDLVWTVQFRQLVEDDCAECGETEKTSTKITINPAMNDDLIYRTIRHEVVHAFVWSYGFENSFPMTEEQVCNFIETHGKDIEKITNQIWSMYCKKDW